jgi:DNA-binding CsgD family transcriptional regulator
MGLANNQPAPWSQIDQTNGPGSTPDHSFLDQALLGWVGLEPRARMLVDDALRVHWMSPAAEELLRRPNSLLIRNGCVHTRENRFERQLRQLVNDASARVSTCCFYDAKFGQHIVLTAVRLSAPSQGMVGLTFLRASDDVPFDLVDLHSAFGFTQTEARVTYCLISGRTAGETAEDLGVSLETVRTHIKRAYAKLGVSSREGFFRRLSPFVIPLS